MNSRILLVEDEPGLSMTIADLLTGDHPDMRSRAVAELLDH